MDFNLKLSLTYLLIRKWRTLSDVIRVPVYRKSLRMWGTNSTRYSCCKFKYSYSQTASINYSLNDYYFFPSISGWLYLKMMSKFRNTILTTFIHKNLSCNSVAMDNNKNINNNFGSRSYLSSRELDFVLLCMESNTRMSENSLRSFLVLINYIFHFVDASNWRDKWVPFKAYHSQLYLILPIYVFSAMM